MRFLIIGNFKCDFICIRDKAIIQAIQVTWELLDSNRRRDINNFISILKDLSLSNGLIITLDQNEEIIVDTITLIIKSVWNWLLES